MLGTVIVFMRLLKERILGLEHDYGTAIKNKMEAYKKVL